MSKPLLYLCLLGILFSGCKKFKQQATGIKLDAPTVSGSKVSLKWSPLLNATLTGYQIVKITDSTSLQTMETFYVDKNTTQYTDTLSLSPYTQYYIYAQTNSGSGVVSSNKQLITRTDIDFMHITPLGVVVDKDANKAYIYSSSGDIALCDLSTKKLIKQIAANAQAGHCCLGTYNGHKELYVPRSDGWVFVYDATTLDQLDQLNVSVSAYGVAYSNGRVFVNSAEYGQLTAVDRATKALTTQHHTEDRMRMLMLPGSNNSFVGMNMWGDISRYAFTPADGFVYNYSADLPTTTNVFDLVEFFPDGKRIIASSEGIIVDTALTYKATLPHGDMRYTSFDFDPATQLIYASCTTQVVHAYNMDSYQLTTTKATRGYPFKVSTYNGTLISISTSRKSFVSDQPVQEPMYTFIEQL